MTPEYLFAFAAASGLIAAGVILLTKEFVLPRLVDRVRRLK